MVMRDPEEDVKYGGGGHYTEIDPPTRLVFTWTWDDEADRETLEIELDFEEAEGATTVDPHPQQPSRPGSGAVARRRLGCVLRQPRTGVVRAPLRLRPRGDRVDRQRRLADATAPPPTPDGR